MKIKFLLLLSTAFSYGLFGQSDPPVTLREGLLLSLPPNTVSQTISLNPIVAAMETGTWKTPKEHDHMKVNDATMGRWKKIVADSSGWMQDSTLEKAYVYFEYQSPKEQVALVEGMGHTMVYVNGSARSGNPYRLQDVYESWGPRFDYSFIPVKLRKGENQFLFECNRGALKVLLHPHANGFRFIETDGTLPDLFINEASDTYGALPLVNATENFCKGLFVKTWADGSAPAYQQVNNIVPLSITKIPFAIQLPGQPQPGKLQLHVAVVKNKGANEEVLTASVIELNVVHPEDTHKETFISAIDGSVQYYAVNPPKDLKVKPALFLSLHGAGVEAINQAQAYGHKNWGYVVAPTNRRPYGFNWENWGRMDALEVLNIVKEKFHIDENRVYLTGHSMGGHGTWQLGVHYADQFAAIGPSAGWISIWSYRIKSNRDSMEVGRMLTRSVKSSDTYAFTTNLQQNGIYILHGNEDDNVPPSQAESIVANLSKFHKDYIYHVEPGVGHWWDKSDEPGADCVDWKPMFNFFARHANAGSNRTKMIHFVTADPAIASRDYWVEVINQKEQQKLSTIDIQLDQGNRKFFGSTNNIELLSIDAAMLSTDTTCQVVLDSQLVAGIRIPSDKKIYMRRTNGAWTLTEKPQESHKVPARCGNFREVLNHHPVFVYGTYGTTAENNWAFNKARYDAEKLWYRGNSSIELISDSEFDPAAYKDRSVLVYGNAKINSAWNLLLKTSPIQVDRKRIRIGEKVYEGDDYTCIMIRPRLDSKNASVGVVCGTGIEGMNLANVIQYFDQYLSFPDVVVYNSHILQSNEMGVVYTGYFGNDWSLENGEFVAQ